MKLKDGGSIQYKALLYKITNYHKLASEGSNKEYIDGIGIEILGIDQYCLYIMGKNNHAKNMHS